MKRINYFEAQEKYGNRKHKVGLYYDRNKKNYVIKYKYASMENFEDNIHISEEYAMYDFTKKVMFLLS